MNAQAILTKIEEDAGLLSAEIVAGAKRKAQEMERACEERIDKAEKAMMAQLESEKRELESRMLRMADLEERKELLAKKRLLIDECFAKAYERLKAQKPETLREFFARQTELAASGAEKLLIGAQNSEWFDESFIAEVNARLVKSGKKGELTALPEKREGVTGLMLISGTAEINITLEALMETDRTRGETDVARVLFEE